MAITVISVSTKEIAPDLDVSILVRDGQTDYAILVKQFPMLVVKHITAPEPLAGWTLITQEISFKSLESVEFYERAVDLAYLIMKTKGAALNSF